MQAYEARKAAYFGTPAVNLVYAPKRQPGPDPGRGHGSAFLPAHQALGKASQAAMAALGLGQVPLSTEIAACTLSAPRFPKGVDGGKFLAATGKAGLILAGGLHPAIKE